jgi:hypothetical protein
MFAKTGVLAGRKTLYPVVQTTSVEERVFQSASHFLQN